MEIITIDNSACAFIRINNKYNVNIINYINYDYYISIIICKSISLHFEGDFIRYHSIIGKSLINKYNCISKLKLYKNNLVCLHIYFIYNKYYFNKKNDITIEYLGDHGNEDLIYNDNINAIKNIFTCKNYKSTIYIIYN